MGCWWQQPPRVAARATRSVCSLPRIARRRRRKRPFAGGGLGRGFIRRLARVNPHPALRRSRRFASACTSRTAAVGRLCLPRKRGRYCGAFSASPHHIRRPARRDQLARIVLHLGVRDRDAVAEPHHAPGGDEILAAPGPQIVDAQVDRADLREAAASGLTIRSLFTARWTAKPAATSSTAAITPPCRICRRVLPISSGRMSKRSFGASGSIDVHLQPEHAVERHAVLEDLPQLGFHRLALVRIVPCSPSKLFRGEILHDLLRAAADR